MKYTRDQKMNKNYQKFILSTFEFKEINQKISFTNKYESIEQNQRRLKMHSQKIGHNSSV